MRILIYGINFAPELTGIGKFTGEMAQFLAQSGYDVRVITAPPYYPMWKISSGYTGASYRKEVWRGVAVFRCPIWVPGNHGKISGVKRLIHLASFACSSLPVAISQVRWSPDRVVALAPSIFNAPAASWVARWSGAKSWLHIQDFELDAALGLKILPGLQGVTRLAQAAERALYRRFDCVSTISGRMLARLLQRGVPPDKAVLFPNWVDTRQVYPISGYNCLRQELGLDGGKVILLYSGNMGLKQGLDILVEAARLLADDPRFFFLLCGEGVARPQLESQAKDLENIRFLPLQAEDRLNDLLNLADIHVLPQSTGAADLVMPSKLTGMLASGRPVIVTAQPGTELAEVMESIGWVAPPGQPTPLAEAIRFLADRPELRLELGRRGRAFVEQNWSREIVLGHFLEKIQSL